MCNIFLFLLILLEQEDCYYVCIYVFCLQLEWTQKYVFSMIINNAFLPLSGFVGEWKTDQKIE